MWCSCRHQPLCKATWHTPTRPPAPTLSSRCLPKCDLFTATILGQSVSHPGRSCQVCSSSPFPTANRFPTVSSLHMCCNQSHAHGPLHSNTSSFMNAISLLAKRGPRQCKHRTLTHENFRLNGSCSEAAMCVAAV